MDGLTSLFKKLFPYRLKRNIKDGLGVPSLHWSLLNLKRCGFDPEFTIDIGAYIGEWTESFLEIYPGRKVLMIEGQQSKKRFLEKITFNYRNVNYHIGILSANDGSIVTFLENETASHVASLNEDLFAGGKKCTANALDKIIESAQFSLPNFIKLDVQGHELEVLKGATRCLGNCEVCLLEVTFLDINPQDPLVLEVMNFMDERGFQVYDISQLMRRPFDRALYQADIFFVRKTSQLLKSKRWN